MTSNAIPSDDDARKCLRIRKRSKSGIEPQQDEREFCEKMWKRYRQWYADTEPEVFNDTVPFGSKAVHSKTKREETT